MAGVTLDKVTKQYGSVAAVKDVTIEVPDKEFLVLVGPSGCGKSTTLRLVAGLEAITSGRIYIGDRLVNQVPPKDRDIAMVFQSYALYPHMSVYDNLAFGLKLRGVRKPEIQRRVGEAAGILGLEALLKRKPRELSGGQRQRVALGRAIVREPHVFLMDEPLSNLDAKLRVQTRAELVKLHQRLQTTVLYVTHDQVEAMTMGTRIAVMHEGTLQQVDTPQRIYQHPANMFVAEFIGSPSMNFIAARLLGNPDAIRVETADFSLPVPVSRAPALAPWLGQEVIIGIRPEHIWWRGQWGAQARDQRQDPHEQIGSQAHGLGSRSTDAVLNARLDLVETLGSEAILHLVCGGTTLVARTAYDSDLRAGRETQFIVDRSRLHVFDPQTQQSLPGDTRAS